MTKGQLINTLKDSDGLAGANPTIDDDTLYMYGSRFIQFGRGQVIIHESPSVLLSLEAFRAIYEYAHGLSISTQKEA